MAIVTAYACEKEEGENETNISSYQSNDSHHMGENCMECHKSGGSGAGWFTVAGTIYESNKTDTYPNATVRLYTGPDGTGNLKATIEVDQLGNFYTTENIDFGSGLYTVVEGTMGTKSMGPSLSNGKCNSCHGVSTDPVWVQ
jgi:hypothetical protein